MQLFFQIFRTEREAKYEYKCNGSVNAQMHARLCSLPLMGTNHQPLFAEVGTVDMSPRLLEAATTATSLQLQLAKRWGLFRGPSSNIYMRLSIDKSSKLLSLSQKKKLCNAKQQLNQRLPSADLYQVSTLCLKQPRF